VFIQSFETANLRQLDRRTDLPLVQLLDCTGAPYDEVVAGDDTTYADLVTPRGLRQISTYADGIGPCKNLVIPRTATDQLGKPTALVRDAHREDLLVHPFTFRRENQFLPADYRSSPDPNQPGDMVG
jgi:glycerophosphoryl diester phosphodiesterase